MKNLCKNCSHGTINFWGNDECWTDCHGNKYDDYVKREKLALERNANKDCEKYVPHRITEKIIRYIMKLTWLRFINYFLQLFFIRIVKCESYITDNSNIVSINFVYDDGPIKILTNRILIEKFKKILYAYLSDANNNSEFNIPNLPPDDKGLNTFLRYLCSIINGSVILKKITGNVVGAMIGGALGAQIGGYFCTKNVGCRFSGLEIVLPEYYAIAYWIVPFSGWYNDYKIIGRKRKNTPEKSKIKYKRIFSKNINKTKKKGNV